MAKHRAGDRRIITVSIPENLARRLDARVGKGLSLIHISEPTET